MVHKGAFKNVIIMYLIVKMSFPYFFEYMRYAHGAHLEKVLSAIFLMPGPVVPCNYVVVICRVALGIAKKTE